MQATLKPLQRLLSSTRACLRLVELRPGESQVPANSMECASPQVPVGVSWNAGLCLAFWVNPDFVRAAGLAVEPAAQVLQFSS